MTGYAFRNLVAWQRAFELGNEVRGRVGGWPAIDQESVGLQLVRSCDSVAANIAEATGRWYANDKRRLLHIARGSLHETEHWILTAQARHLLDNTFDDRLAELGRTLNGLIKRPGAGSGS
jgi:four helix bundle protein